jgi:hypothetical protein
MSVYADAVQLNFITGYDKESTESSENFEFWDSSYNLVNRKKARLPIYKNAEAFFNVLDSAEISRYKNYWESITPRNDSDRFRRWLFAFMSVHTSWKSNLNGYQAVKDWWTWLNQSEHLLAKISDSRVGMQNNRLKYLTEFSYKFWANPSDYKKDKTESWAGFRDRLKDSILGLGAAKTSFAIEMCYPNIAEVTCFDTHMFQVYGLDQTKDARHYHSIEQHWIDMCKMWNVPPYIARCIFWDKKQGHQDSRYWSHILEK